jgi:hypothetical protein
MRKSRFTPEQILSSGLAVGDGGAGADTRTPSAGGASTSTTRARCMNLRWRTPSGRPKANDRSFGA